MKRIFICFCAILLCCVSLEFGISCEASAFSPYDLSDFGISSLKAEPVGNRNQSFRLSLGSGLRLLSSGGAYEAESYPFQTEKSLVYQDLSFAYSDDSILVDAAYSPAATRLFSSVFHPKYGNVYMITLELSLVPGNRVCERMSSLTNTYFFSAADLCCVAVEGMRVRYGSNGGSLIARFSGNENQNAYVSSEGLRWDSAAYCSKASMLREGEGESSQFRFSFYVSIEDLAATLSAEEIAYLHRALAGEEAFLCGGFDLRPVIDENVVFSGGVCDMLCLSASLPCFTPCPLPDGGQNWNQYLAEMEVADSSIFTHVLAPLYFVGNVQDVPVTDEPNNTPPSDSQANVMIESSVSSQPPEMPPEHKVESADPPVTEEAPSSDLSVPSVSSERFPFWEDLPDAESLPEETERIFDSEEQEKTDLLSTLLFLGGGILLFLTVVAASVLFRIDEKKGKKSKKS